LYLLFICLFEHPDHQHWCEFLSHDQWQTGKVFRGNMIENFIILAKYNLFPLVRKVANSIK